MTVLSATELTQIRTWPQSSHLMLSIYQPPTVLMATINQADIARGDYVFGYTTVSGTYAAVEPGMTLYVGTTPGGKDKGTLRVRGISASQLSVAENFLDWSDGLHLTVIDYVELWPIFPKYTQVGENVTFYKDVDIAYSNQNSILGTFVCMGPHHAACIGTSGTVSVYYTSSGTYNLLGESLSYSWIFDGGTPGTSSGSVPGYVSYDTPGHYTTRLQVTSSSGAVDTSYRYVSIYADPYKATNGPIQEWGFISPPSGSRDQGGYTTSVWVRENTVSIVDGALVVFFSDDYYGNSNVSIGGNASNRSSIFFTGYIRGSSIEYNYRDSRVEFEIVSATIRMQDMETYAVQTNRSSAPTTWYQILNQDGKRAVYSYLRWQSTALMVNDFEWDIADKYIYSFQSDRASLYDAIQSFVQNTYVANFICDRQGKMFCETSPAAITGSFTYYETSQVVDKMDWMGAMSIDEVITPPLGYLEMGGTLSVDDLAENDVPYLAGAPGAVAGYRGSASQRSGLALNSQEDLNRIVGDVYAYENARYPNVSISMVGNYRHFDIVPVEYVGLVVSSADNYRGIAWNAKKFHITDMSWNYNPKTEFLHPNIMLHEITQGVPGETIIIPDEPPDDDGDPNTPPNEPDPPTPPTISGSVSSVASFLYQWPTTSASRWQILHYSEQTNTSEAIVNGTSTLVRSGAYSATPIVACGDYYYWYQVEPPAGVETEYKIYVNKVRYDSGSVVASLKILHVNDNYVPQLCLMADNVVAILWVDVDYDVIGTKIDFTSVTPVATTLFSQMSTIGEQVLGKLDFFVPTKDGRTTKHLLWGCVSTYSGGGYEDAKYNLFRYNVTTNVLDQMTFDTFYTGYCSGWLMSAPPQIIDGWVVFMVYSQLLGLDPTAGEALLVAHHGVRNISRYENFRRVGDSEITAISSGAHPTNHKVYFSLEGLTISDPLSSNLMWVFPDAIVGQDWYLAEPDTAITPVIRDFVQSSDSLYGVSDGGVVIDVTDPDTEICTIPDYSKNTKTSAIAHYADDGQNRIWVWNNTTEKLLGYLIGGTPTVREVPIDLPTLLAGGSQQVLCELIGRRFVLFIYKADKSTFPPSEMPSYDPWALYTVYA